MVKPNVRIAVLLAVALLVLPSTTSPQWVPRIVNGTPTSDYSPSALIILYSSARKSSVAGFCSGTLIGCQAVLTAGHCVCDNNADTYADCVTSGITDPRRVEVFLPVVGVLPVRAVHLHPQYEFSVRSDMALLVLDERAEGLRPAQLVDEELPLGTEATVVGYGTTRDGARAVDDTGIKRAGPVTLSECPSDVPSGANLCWNFLGSGSNSCGGDSGGGLFVRSRKGESLLAGVVSGGSSYDCQAPDVSFATAVAANRDWLVAELGDELGKMCAPLGVAGEPPNSAHFWQADLSSTTDRVEWTLLVRPGTRELRVTFNGQTASARGFSQMENDFDLYVFPPGESPSEAPACADERPNNWGACQIVAPRPGEWVVRVARVQGQGPIQVAAAQFVDSTPCALDCDGDDSVDVSELVRAVTIALGELPVEACTSADINGDGQVTVEEILAGVYRALEGCG